ncbi:hypothetical protein NEOC95_000879 [Neochlamydia sp. AcF95]|nr:hypothetical protein [Neochlamydia sp. AcF95]
MGNALYRLEQNIEAKDSYEKAMRTYEDISSPIFPYYQKSQLSEVLESLARTHLNLVKVLAGLRYFAEAFRHCQRAKAILQKLHPLHPLLQDVQYSLRGLSEIIEEKSRNYTIYWIATS